MPFCQARAEQDLADRRQGASGMTQIIAGTKTEFSIDPAILDLLPAQGSVELQRDASGKVHHFHTHPVDEILVIIKGALKFEWEGGTRICRPGDTIRWPAGTLHQSAGRDGGATHATRKAPPPASPPRRNLKDPTSRTHGRAGERANVMR